MNIDNYFFVVGCPRSGTTLLGVILDRHTRLCVPPETAFFNEVAPFLLRHDDNTLLEVLRNWSRLGELVLEPELVLRRLNRPGWTPSEVLASILNLYAEAQGKARCGEKTPEHLMHVQTILQQFPNAKIICMLRDGRDVALSLNSMPWWSPQNLEDAASHWKASVQLAETFTQQYPTQFKVVRYEDLVIHPEGVLSSIMQYLGETFEPGQFRSDFPSRTVLPRSLKWKGQALQPIDVGLIGWRRTTATTEQITFLEQVLGEELRRHGYELP